MKRLSLILTIAFIIIYVVLTNVGSVLTTELGTPYLGQNLLLLVFSVFLFIYTAKKRLMDTVGLTGVRARDAKVSLFYIPLILIILSNGVFFFDAKMPLFEILMTVVFMAFVACAEELLFRGLLFKAIEERSGSKAAVIVSGVTFGFGHILNLFNGYTGLDQIMQIVVAVLIGVVLSLLFICTKSIVPGIVFHFLFNSASALSTEVEPLYNYIMVGVIVVIGSAYLLYLLRGVSRYVHTQSTVNKEGRRL